MENKWLYELCFSIISTFPLCIGNCKENKLCALKFEHFLGSFKFHCYLLTNLAALPTWYQYTAAIKLVGNSTKLYRYLAKLKFHIWSSNPAQDIGHQILTCQYWNGQISNLLGCPHNLNQESTLSNLFSINAHGDL